MDLGISAGEMVTRLVLAAILGAIIGLERESHGRPAGFRTHIVVSVGSSLIMLVSMFAFGRPGSGVEGLSYDPGRLAAQVVSGIGFLGAGTILREGVTVRGLTTAASLWTVAAIGLAVGSGFYLGAIVSTFIVVVALFVLNRLPITWIHPAHEHLSLTIVNGPGMLGSITSLLGRQKVNIVGMELQEGGGNTTVIDVSVEMPARLNRSALMQELIMLDGVLQASYR